MNAIEVIREAGGLALLAYVLLQNRPLLQELLHLLKEMNKTIIILQSEMVEIRKFLDRNK